jgi:uncharacterized protein (DUF58 family)
MASQTDCHVGHSVEFAEHKVYTPGDDTRHLDWRAFARFDRYYIKRFLDETNLRAFLICDLSASMAYAGGHERSLKGARKADYARTLCATLAWLLIRQSDSVGAVTFSETAGPHTSIRGGQRQLEEIVAALEQAAVGGKTHPRAALSAALSQLSRRSLVVVCSDLMDQGVEVLEPMMGLRNRGADVVLLHVLHPDEVHFPYDGTVRFLDLEGLRQAQVDPQGIRNAYLDELHQWLAAQEQAATRAGLDYHRILTDEPPSRALLRVLSRRRRAE